MTPTSNKPRSNRSGRKFLFTTVAVVALAYGGWHYFGHAGSASAGAPPASEVTVQTLQPETVTVWTQYSGRMSAVDSAEIRPEVSGKITEVRFKDGQNVKAGDLLMVIDPRSYEATLARAEANAALAKLELTRASNLVKARAIAQTVYDQRATQNKVAQAELQTARVNVDYAYVKAPISGRVGRTELTVGNHVEAGPNAPLLTTIVSNKGIYADFEVDEQTYMRAIRAHANNQASEQKIPVTITVQGSEDHPYKGTIYTFDNRIAPGSGTIRARAKFSNSDGGLLPGMFVNVHMASAMDTTTLLVPARAVSNDQSKLFVYTVGEDNKVAYRAVALGADVDNRRIVLSGLNAGDRVVVDGLMRVQPDAVVNPKEIENTPPAAEKTAAAN